MEQWHILRFLPFLIKRLLKWLSMENGTLNTYRNSSFSLSEIPQKSITVITMPSFFDYNYQTNFEGQSLLPGNLFIKWFPFSSFSPYILKLKTSTKHSTFHCLVVSVKYYFYMWIFKLNFPLCEYIEKRREQIKVSLIRSVPQGEALDTT